MVDDSPEKKREDVMPKGSTESNETSGIVEKQNENEVASLNSDVDDKNSNGDKCDSNLSFTFSLKDHSSLPELKKIKINLTRSDKVDELVRNKFGLMNGDASE